MKQDTIVALATASGRSGVAIVRVSGTKVSKIAENILKKNLTPRFATLSSFFDASGTIIDQGIAIYFPAPNSFTGEDILELQGHGGAAVTHCLIQQVVELGARLANPGEFSERAFLNDKIDLIQAEAIADLIDASSEQASRNAMRSLQGEFSKKIKSLVDALIYLRMFVEASIDFIEEEIDFLNNKEVHDKLNHIIHDLNQIQSNAVQGSLIREGITAVITGPPNVGKSSLLNQLSGKEIAIVTPIPGTTRDILRETILIDNLPMHVIDTAGLRESNDVVEQIGIERAREQIGHADLILFMQDASQPHIELSEFLKNIPRGATLITIKNKIDLIKEKPSRHIFKNNITISISAKEDWGLDLLKQEIKKAVGINLSLEDTFSARRRHLDALARAEKCLKNGKQQLLAHRAGELLAEDLRQAQNALNEITGEFVADDLLGKIFGSFCIGK